MFRALEWPSGYAVERNYSPKLQGCGTLRTPIFFDHVRAVYFHRLFTDVQFCRDPFINSAVRLQPCRRRKTHGEASQARYELVKPQ
jgi:hypothetical protein